MLIVWGVVITLSIVVLMVVAFSRLRRNRLFDNDAEWTAAAKNKKLAVESWRSDAESGRRGDERPPSSPSSVADIDGPSVHRPPRALSPSSTMFDSDAEADVDGLEVDDGRLSCRVDAAAGNQNEEELNSRDIASYVQLSQ